MSKQITSLPHFEMRYVYAAAKDIAVHMDRDKIVVNKSTVPVGTARELQSLFQKELEALGKQSLRVAVASNPEFLREGKAVGDFNNPDRIVLGVDGEEVKEKFWRDPSVLSHCRSDQPCVCPNLFAEVCNFVGKGNFCRQESVGRVFDHFGSLRRGYKNWFI